MFLLAKQSMNNTKDEEYFRMPSFFWQKKLDEVLTQSKLMIYGDNIIEVHEFTAILLQTSKEKNQK